MVSQITFMEPTQRFAFVHCKAHRNRLGLTRLPAAERYPSARIIGTDLSPIQSKWVSPNCEFRIEDLEDEQRPWTSIYGGADLIHIRGLVATLRRPQRLIDRSFEYVDPHTLLTRKEHDRADTDTNHRNIRPGGWIELHEIIPEVQSDDGTATMSHPLNQLYTLLRGSYSQRFGWDLDTPRRIEQMLESAGFVNVQTRHNHVPLGRWGKDQRSREMGMFCQSVCEDLVAALSTRHAALGISEEEAGRMSGEFLRAANDLSVHGWLDWVDVWAQKPGGA